MTGVLRFCLFSLCPSSPMMRTDFKMLWKTEAGGSLSLSTMRFGLLKNFSVFGSRSTHEVVPESRVVSSPSSPDLDPENILHKPGYSLQDVKTLRTSLLSTIPWGKKSTHEPYDQKLSRDSAYMKIHKSVESGCPVLLFRPFVAKVPWHKGLRAFLSQMFPRYGHYCGPNWSSGKDNGTLLWDRRPVDWLDFCCYCHDIGYDTHDQAKLLKADLTFLQCLEKHTHFKGDNHWVYFYRSLYIAGLRTVLIPYRMQLVKRQSGQAMTSSSNISRSNEIQHSS